MSLRLDWCTPQAARYAAEHWHYSKKLPVGKCVRIGVWEDGEFVGCVVFAAGACMRLGKPYGLTQFECCELSRVALRAHTTPVSRIVAIALRMLRQKCPGIKLVVSFADTNQGHHGGIYQAGNWIYTGVTAKSPVYFDKTGREWHNRHVTVTGISGNVFGRRAKVRKASDLRREVRDGKHRYLMPLDPQTAERVRRLSKPYPKKSADESGSRPDQGEEGGSTPTRPLQIEDRCQRKQSPKRPRRKTAGTSAAKTRSRRSSN